MQVTKREQGSQDKPLRCPYCFENIRGAEADLRDCGACEATMHGACWEELGGCATCRSRGGPAAATQRPALARGGRRPRPADPTETRDILEFVLSPFTLVAYPALSAETRLQALMRERLNALPRGELSAAQDRYQAAAREQLEGSVRRRRRMVGLLCSVLAAPVLTLLAGLLFKFPLAAAGVVYLAGVSAWYVGVIAHLFFHRRAYRRLDAELLGSEVLMRGVPEEEARRRFLAQRETWKTNLLKTIGIFGLAVVPVASFLLFFAFVFAYRWPRKLHERRLRACFGLFADASV